MCFRNLYVVKYGGPPLIGRIGLKQLGLGIAEIQTIVPVSNNDIKLLCNKYSELFNNELGEFNKFKVSLKLNENVTPKFFKPRPLPIALKEKVETEIDRLVNQGVLVPVEFSEWGTPIVPVLKSDGSVRICGDYKATVNPNLAPIHIYPLHRIEYLFSQLQGGQYFSKIDLSQAYQQILVDSDTQKVLTISTHKGLFTYTRLPFGIRTAQRQLYFRKS